MMTRMKTSQGFTLTELMIVVMIAGILISISVPAYRSFVLKSHRTDARSSLIDIAARQERFMAQNNTYTADLISNAGLNLGSTTSKEGYYSLSVTAGATNSISTSYRITATAIGPQQTKDSRCLTMSYDSNGDKSGTSADCW